MVFTFCFVRVWGNKDKMNKNKKKRSTSIGETNLAIIFRNQVSDSFKICLMLNKIHMGFAFLFLKR